MSGVDPNGGSALLVPSAGGGGGLPVAGGAGEVPVSSGAGTTYSALGGDATVDAIGATRKTLTQSVLGAAFGQRFRFYAPISTAIPFGSLTSVDNDLAPMVYNAGAKTITAGLNADVSGFGLATGMGCGSRFGFRNRRDCRQFVGELLTNEVPTGGGLLVLGKCEQPESQETPSPWNHASRCPSIDSLRPVGNSSSW